MTINWNEQWELHAPNFTKEFARVCLKDYGGPNLSFKMEPGPGFGDLSHPTTKIMLKLMPKNIETDVIDVGCGSGVLSLAAKLLGAPSVYGIDIDEGALKHAKSNATLSQLDCSFNRHISKSVSSPLILMNMISSEQKCAWETLPSYPGSILITSGFPEDEAPPKHYGAILETLILDGWKGFKIQLLREDKVLKKERCLYRD